MMKMILRRPPIAPLRPFIESMAVFDQTLVCDDNAYLCIPTTYSFIIFNQYLLAGRMRACLFVGASHRVLREIPIKGCGMMGARIWPGCLKFFMSIPSYELQESILPLEDIWGRGGAELLEKMWEAPTNEERLQIMENALLQRLARNDDSAAFIWEADRIIRASRWTISIRELADSLGFTNRQLERKFLDFSGFTPKEFFKTMRCHSVAQRISQSRFRDWGQLIYEYNYYDQSHFIREFSQAMRHSPGEYCDRLRETIQPLKEINPEPNEGATILAFQKKALTLPR